MKTRIAFSVLAVILSLVAVIKSCETTVSVAHSASSRILTEKDFEMGRLYSYSMNSAWVLLMKTSQGWLIRSYTYSSSFMYIPDPGHEQQWIVNE